MALDQIELARNAGHRLAATAALLELLANANLRQAEQPLLRAIAVELACAVRWHLLSALPDSDALSADIPLAALCDLFVLPPSHDSHRHHSVALELHQLAADDDSWLIALARAAGDAYRLPAPAALASNALQERLKLVDLSAQRWSQPVDWSAAALQKWYDNSREIINRHREQAVEC